MSELKNCPFCGNAPTVEVIGSHIDITCCASMSRQKSDYLDANERMLFDGGETFMYPDLIEEKVMALVAEEWNARSTDPIVGELTNRLAEALSRIKELEDHPE